MWWKPLFLYQKAGIQSGRSGRKIRVMENDVYVKLMDFLGATAVPMAYGEIYRALQTGVIDIDLFSN